MAEQWRKIPTAWIANLGSVHWSKANQAPDAVGFIWAVDQLAGGVPLSIRGLASAMGWSRRRAATVHTAAMQWVNLPEPSTTKNANLPDVKRSAKRATSDTTNGPQATPPKTNDSEQLEPNPDRICTTARATFAPLHARAVVVTRENRIDLEQTNVGFCDEPPKPDPVDSEPEPKPEPKPDALAALWSELQDIRLRNVKGKRSRLGGRRDALRRRVAEHGRDPLVRAWLWLWESDHQRATFIRDNGFGMSTFLRAKNLRDYVEMSSEWNPEAKPAAVDIWNATADDFDDAGNLRAH